MNALRKNRILFAAAALFAAACSVNGHYGNGDDNFFSSFTTFENARWSYAAPIEIAVDTLADSICQRGDLLLTLRHTEGYPYSNIWLELNYDTDDSTSVADTLNIVLADAYGHWRGRGPGNTYSVSDTVLRDVPLRRHQNITLRHIMRVDTLEEIEQAGLTYLPKP